MSHEARARALPKVLALIPLLSIIGVALTAAVVKRPFRTRVPSEASVELLRRWLAPRLQARDAVAIRPAWHSILWRAVESGLPDPRHSRQMPHLGLLNGTTIDPGQLAAVQRLWVVSVAGLGGRLPTLGDGWRPETIRGDDGSPTIVYRGISAYEIRRYAKLRQRVRYDFVARLADAKVWREGGGTKPGLCRWQGWQMRCPKITAKQGWFDVRTRINDLHDAEVESILLNPGAPGARLHISYDAVPIGRTLEGAISTHVHAANAQQGDAVEMLVLIDGKAVVYRWQHPNGTSVQRFRVDTTLFRGEFHRVELIFTAKGSIDAREILVHGQSLD